MQFQLSNGQDCGFVFTHRGGVGKGRVHMQRCLQVEAQL